jgi:hypothetical protein
MQTSANLSHTHNQSSAFNNLATDRLVSKITSQSLNNINYEVRGNKLYFTNPPISFDSLVNSPGASQMQPDVVRHLMRAQELIATGQSSQLTVFLPSSMISADGKGPSQAYQMQRVGNRVVMTTIDLSSDKDKAITQLELLGIKVSSNLRNGGVDETSRTTPITHQELINVYKSTNDFAQAQKYQDMIINFAFEGNPELYYQAIEREKTQIINELSAVGINVYNPKAIENYLTGSKDNTQHSIRQEFAYQQESLLSQTSIAKEQPNDWARLETPKHQQTVFKEFASPLTSYNQSEQHFIAAIYAEKKDRESAVRIEQKKEYETFTTGALAHEKKLAKESNIEKLTQLWPNTTHKPSLSNTQPAPENVFKIPRNLNSHPEMTEKIKEKFLSSSELLRTPSMNKIDSTKSQYRHVAQSFKQIAPVVNTTSAVNTAKAKTPINPETKEIKEQTKPNKSTRVLDKIATLTTQKKRNLKRVSNANIYAQERRTSKILVQLRKKEAILKNELNRLKEIIKLQKQYKAKLHNKLTLMEQRRLQHQEEVFSKRIKKIEKILQKINIHKRVLIEIRKSEKKINKELKKLKSEIKDLKRRHLTLPKHRRIENKQKIILLNNELSALLKQRSTLRRKKLSVIKQLNKLRYYFKNNSKIRHTPSSSKTLITPLVTIRKKAHLVKISVKELKNLTKVKGSPSARSEASKKLLKRLTKLIRSKRKHVKTEEHEIMAVFHQIQLMLLGNMQLEEEQLERLLMALKSLLSSRKIENQLPETLSLSMQLLQQ